MPDMLNQDQLKILIIDDEEVVLDSCTLILGEENYQIATAINGELGISLVKEFRPDLVFVDLKMPGLSGFQVIEGIVAIDPNIVTIVITGYATLSSAIEAMKKGAYDFLPKPFTPDEFRLVTRRGIDRRKLVLETIALRKEKEMLREHFAAIVSHELRSPLSAIQQNLFVLTSELSTRLTEEQNRRLERIKIRIGDLLKLISTWLQVISGDIGQIQENFKPTSILSVISKAVESVEPHAMRKEIEISSSIEEPLSLVNGDEVTLVEVLVNLLTNAVKFSRLGSRVQIQARQEEHEMVISVVDSGVGISREDLPHIFGDFYVGRSGSTGEGGSGVGLAISRRIVEAHHGSLSVESDLGKGSTFTIRLPIQVQPEDKQLSDYKTI